MFLIRESSPRDAEQVLEVARHLDTVNLPADIEHLKRILALSEQSFSGQVEPAAREYLFVLEDLDKKKLIGTSMIHAQHGTRRAPHIYLQVLQDERYSETLDRYMVHQALRLGYNYNGPTEIGGLILLPEYRGHSESLGKLLSYTRFLFIAMHRDVFRDEVISELLPPLEADGTSKLWKHFGKRFTGLSYQEADLLSKDNKEFIRTLFPHGMIYTALMPEDVRADIGKVGKETAGVERMLRKIGFEYANQIDPFDGGPHFKARTDNISVVANSGKVNVRTVETADRSRPWAIVAAEHDSEPRFRACGGRVIPGDGDELGVTASIRDAIGSDNAKVTWAVIP
jgi:arginine N-succinyltransferase